MFKVYNNEAQIRKTIGQEKRRRGVVTNVDLWTVTVDGCT